MIIKTIKGHKSRNPSKILKLLRYIHNEEKMASPTDGKSCFSKQFLRGFDAEPWVNQILECDKAKTYNNHINRVIVRHEVCSFSRESSSYLLRNRNVLKEIQREYLKRRSSAPGIAVVHYEEGKQIHIHFAFGATNIDGTSNRLNNKQFKEFKHQIESFQRSRYPELHHSEIEHGYRKKKAEQEPIKRLK